MNLPQLYEAFEQIALANLKSGEKYLAILNFLAQINAAPGKDVMLRFLLHYPDTIGLNNI